MKYTIKEFKELATRILNLKPNESIDISGDKYEFSQEDLNELQKEVRGIISIKGGATFSPSVILSKGTIASHKTEDAVFFDINLW